MTELRRRRAAAQRLHRPEALAPADLVGALLAVQAQDLRAARLALRARAAGLTASAVDAALSTERSIVVTWLMRGTRHLVAAEDHGWLLGLFAPMRQTGNRRRLGQEGVTPDAAQRAVAHIERALAAEGPLTRAQLAERLAQAGIPTGGQAMPHLLAAAALRGLIVLGPLHPDGHAFALTRDWLGTAPPPPLEGAARDRALTELARRYLRAHGPADDRDLAAWSGLALRDARAGLAGVAPPDGAGAPPARVPPRLLGAFDPYLLGYADRGFAVPADHARRVHPGGGMLRAVATVDGRAVATWTRARDGAVALDVFAPLADADAAALRAEADEVRAFEQA